MRWHKAYYLLVALAALIAIWIGLPMTRRPNVGAFIYGDCGLAEKERDPTCVRSVLPWLHPDQEDDFR